MMAIQRAFEFSRQIFDSTIMTGALFGFAHFVSDTYTLLFVVEKFSTVNCKVLAPSVSAREV